MKERDQSENLCLSEGYYNGSYISSLGWRVLD